LKTKIKNAGHILTENHSNGAGHPLSVNQKKLRAFQYMKSSKELRVNSTVQTKKNCGPF
jgi:hypothetical protein